MSDDIPPGIYQHYKGGIYRVIGSATHTETEERLTLYQQRDDKAGKVWARPAAMFGGTVEIDGKIQPRFRLLEPTEGERHD